MEGKRMSEDFSDVFSILKNTYKDIEENQNKAGNVINAWKKTLFSVKSNVNENEGKNLAEHTRVVDLKNGMLFIETDHPGWIELLKIHKKYILTGMNMKVPELKIKNFCFFLKGQGAQYFGKEISNKNYSDEEKIKAEEEQKKFDQMNARFEGKGLKSNEKNELPDELKDIFAELKSNLLTNSKNK